MTLPNFVIIGAPKCGTSALYNWMLSHPEVCGSLVKEPFFLMDPGHPIQGTPAYATHGLDAWSQHFSKEAEKFPIRMEATTHYLFQESALNVLTSLKDTRICIVLRDPAARVLSSFNYTQNNLIRLDRNLSFEKYFDLVKRRKPLYPKYCTDLRSAFVLERDLEYSEYYVWVKKWVQGMGRDRLKVLIFEDMINSPQDTLFDLFNWLGLPPENAVQESMAPRNVTYKVSYPNIHKMALMVNGILKTAGPIKPILRNVYTRIQRRKLRKVHAIDLNPLRELFLHDIKRLEELLNLDLKIWYPQEGERSLPTSKIPKRL